ncbi:hypothetical protein KP78_04520 [Jeotgalibacillus soli]|uniref:N-acetyltransferase domain-containing protein n=1 Tax=Jeotgalibacillus soli TaxID=889306 RepID=A0A0C2VT35_9BACL|nr:hypothetical protein KP78_04520 [Jeotgalibacillus soli]
MPEYQGRGIGRSALQQVLEIESKSNRNIHLEIHADHEHTLNLYKSCGFIVYHAQDYYDYRANPSHS